MNYRQLAEVLLLLAAGCLPNGGCDSSLTVPTHEQRGITYGRPVIGVTQIEQKYVDGDKLFFGKFADGEEWYMWIALNVRYDDTRRSEQLLAECLHVAREDMREQVLAEIKECGGTVHFMEIVVFRDHLHDVGQYPVGMIVSVTDFLNRDLADEELFGSHSVFQNPIVGKGRDWYHDMVWQHRAGTYREKSTLEPAPPATVEAGKRPVEKRP